VNTVAKLNRAADLVYADAKADGLTSAVGDWLRAEAVTQEQFEPLVDLINLAIETKGGPKAYLTVGKHEDGEIEMRTSTNEHALAVADEILRRYGKSAS
jgi:hypothetical protein